MNYKHYTTLLFALIFTSALNALSLVIEDFESYFDTSSLQADVFSFGSAAQAGRPSLVEGLGENDTNAACFNLTWHTGNNANLSFIRLSPNTKSLSGYTEITTFLYLESYPGQGGFTESSTSTLVKLAIEGGTDNSIWQTRSVKAERPPVDASYIMRFRLNSIDMERIEGVSSLEEVIADIKNLRLRFENTRQAGFRQDAYIDSIVAIQ